MIQQNTSELIMPNIHQPMCVSFFHGIGGMSMGAKRAGFGLLYSTDWEPTAEQAFHLNKNTGVFQRADVLDLNFDKIQRLIQTESNYLLRKGEIDLILSGSPCPGMSGASIVRHWLNDTNFLMHTQTRLACEDGFHSKTAWFEQVPGFMDKPMRKLRREVEARLRAQTDYYYDIQVLDAGDFGATQSRKRVTIIMVRKDIGEPSFPPPQTIDYSKVSVHSLLPDIIEFRSAKDQPSKSSYNTLCCTLKATGQEQVREAGQKWRNMRNDERMVLSGIDFIELGDMNETKKKKLYGNMVQPSFAEAVCNHIRQHILKK